jgi:hypothetical protein
MHAWFFEKVEKGISRHLHQTFSKPHTPVTRSVYIIPFTIYDNIHKRKQAWWKAGTPLIFALLYASTRGA